MADETSSCARCRDAGRGQFFSYDFGDGRVWHFDVDLAARVALEHPETLGLVAVADLLEHTRKNEADEAHVHHVDETIPLLAVTLEVDGNPFAILIDGNHRLRKLATLGVIDAQVYLLNREQTEAVVALGPDGPRSELGRMIQHGQDAPPALRHDREARIDANVESVHANKVEETADVRQADGP